MKKIWGFIMALNTRKLAVLFAWVISIANLHAQSNLGIDNVALNALSKVYLENTLKQYLNQRDLAVTDITATTDWENSSKDTVNLHFFVEGRFVNFPIDRRVLSGRVTTKVLVKRPGPGEKEFKILPEDQTEKIVLLVDDLLSDELRDSIGKCYGRQFLG